MLSRIFIPFVFILLGFGILSGLSRGGAVEGNWFAQYHPVIFITGFFGTLISLERAVGLGKIFFLVPASIVSGVVLYVFFGKPHMLILSSLLFCIPSIFVVRMNKYLFYFLFSSFLFFLGNFAFVLGGVKSASLLLVESLVLFILAERIELSRIVKLRKSDIIFFIFAFFLILFGLVFLFLVEMNYTERSLVGEFPLQLVGVSNIMLGFWFLMRDIARRVINISTGITKFSATAVLLAHISLLISGILILFGKWRVWGGAIHLISLGFVFSMVFGHAPLIFPQIAKVKPVFSRAFYIPLAMLHMSVLVRVVSEIILLHGIKLISLYLNTASILLFFLVMIGIRLKRKIEERKMEEGKNKVVKSY